MDINLIIDFDFGKQINLILSRFHYRIEGLQSRAILQTADIVFCEHVSICLHTSLRFNFAPQVDHPDKPERVYACLEGPRLRPIVW